MDGNGVGSGVVSWTVIRTSPPSAWASTRWRVPRSSVTYTEPVASMPTSPVVSDDESMSRSFAALPTDPPTALRSIELPIT